MDEYTITDTRRQIEIMVAVFVSVLIFSIDFSMMNISLPTISRYFKVSVGSAAFLPMVYIMVVTSSLLGFGKIGDLKGYRKIFIAGLCVFMIGSFLCSLAPSMNVLLALRMFQALGEAMMSPMGVAILTTFLPVRMRGLSLGLVALAQGLGFASGSILGGFINEHFIWRGIFFINIPIAFFAILLSLKVLPSGQKKGADRRFDWIGAVLIFIALAGLVYGLNLLGRLKCPQSLILISFAVLIVGFVLFVIREKKIDYPILDFALFKNRNFTYSNLAAFAAVAVLMGCIFIAPFYLEMVRGLSVMKSGLYLVIAPLTMLFVAPVAGRLSDHIGSRVICASGAFLEAVAFIIFALLTQSSPFLLIAAALFILGLAAGMFMAPNNKLVMSHAPADRQGVASGVYKIGLSVGGVFGIAVFPVVIIQSIIIKSGISNIGADQIRNSPALLQFGFRNMFILAVIISILAFIFSLLAKDECVREQTLPK